jgi:hypothetical protein
MSAHDIACHGHADVGVRGAIFDKNAKKAEKFLCTCAEIVAHVRQKNVDKNQPQETKHFSWHALQSYIREGVSSEDCENVVDDPVWLHLLTLARPGIWCCILILGLCDGTSCS